MSALDEALEVLRDTGPEYAGGLANHGPMAAEALASLGCEEAVVPWTERYRKHLVGPPSRREAIDERDFGSALGDISRFADWAAFFGNALEEAAWTEVVRRWAGILAPGFVGSAAHGVIRVGHAVRGLDAEENAGRKRELSQALAYWASSYQVLPENRGARLGLLPSRAIFHVDVLPEHARRRGLITEGLKSLDLSETFAGVADLVEPLAEPGGFLSDLTGAFAAVYVANADTSGRIIPLIHAVTGPTAVRHLVPHVDADTRGRLMRYAWQGAAGIYAAFASVPRPKEIPDSPETWDEVTERAVATGDEHAIKFTEACRREDARSPSPAYRTAALHAAGKLGAG